MRNMVLVLLMLAVLAGCSTPPRLDRENPDVFRQYVQQQGLQPVKRVQAFRLSGWQVLDDRWLVVGSAPSRDWLLYLDTPCTELRWTEYLVIRQSLPRVLQARFDSVQVPASRDVPCRIREIYPLTPEQAEALRALR